GDGKLDAAVLSAQGAISLLAGNGDGSFQAPATVASGTSPVTSIAVGDFNRDRKPDLVVTTGTGGSAASSVMVLLNNGSGALQAVPAIRAGSPVGNPLAAEVGDFNGDGIPDWLRSPKNANYLTARQLQQSYKAYSTELSQRTYHQSLSKLRSCFAVRTAAQQLLIDS